MADHGIEPKDKRVAKEMLRGANAKKGVADKLFPKATRKKKLDLAKGGARQLMDATIRLNRAKAQNTDSNN